MINIHQKVFGHWSKPIGWKAGIGHATPPFAVFDMKKPFRLKGVRAWKFAKLSEENYRLRDQKTTTGSKLEEMRYIL